MGKWHPLHTAGEVQDQTITIIILYFIHYLNFILYYLFVILLAIGGNLSAVQKEYKKHKDKKEGNVLNDLQDSNGYTALHFAVQCGNVELVKWMIENGANVNVQSLKTADCVTPLIIATSKGLIEVCSTLLKAKANARIGREHNGYTPLHICAKLNHCRIARLILEHDSGTYSILTKDGLSCIDVAKDAGSTQFISTVLPLIPDDQMNVTGSTNSKKTRKSLKAAGERVVSGFDSRLCKTLIEMTRNGNPSRLKDFLVRNPIVDVNWTMGKNGWTALMEVAARGDLLSAKILLESGADTDKRSKKGASALHIAARYGRIELLRILLNHGACLDAVTHAGETVEEVASQYGKSAVLAFLVAFRDELKTAKNKAPEKEATFSNSTSAASMNARHTASSESVTTNDSTGSSNELSLQSWLTEIGLGKYFEILHSNGFDSIQSLGIITAEDFAEMKFLLGHKRLLLAEFNKLKDLFPFLFVPKSYVFSPPSRNVSTDNLSLARSNSNNATQELDTHNTVYAAANTLNPRDEPSCLPMESISFSRSVSQSVRDIELENHTMIKEIRYEELKIGNVIGEGSFGVVHFGVWHGMKVAVKALKMKEGYSTLAAQPTSGEHNPVEKAMCKTDEEFLRHEAKLMARVCNHDHVIQFVGIIVHPHPCVVTVFCAGGTVEDLLVTPNPQRDVHMSTILRMAVETLRGISHLHLEGVIHRDLAARNLLLDGNLRLRVGDFGFSRVKAMAASKGYTKSEMGPIRWQAPEAMRKRMYSEASDMFSFGVVLYEMFWRSVPWPEYDTLDVAIRVCSGERMVVDPCPNDDLACFCESYNKPLGVCLREVMQACWSHDPTSRPTLNDVMSLLETLQSCGNLCPENNNVASPGLNTDVFNDWDLTDFSIAREIAEVNHSENSYSMTLGNNVVFDLNHDPSSFPK